MELIRKVGMGSGSFQVGLRCLKKGWIRGCLFGSKCQFFYSRKKYFVMLFKVKDVECLLFLSAINRLQQHISASSKRLQHQL